MKVAVDARELCGRPTGVGRYLYELLVEWGRSELARRHEWTLYAPATPAAPPAFVDCLRVLPGAGGTAWEQWTLARALGAERPDVLFAPGYSAPLAAPCPTVVAIHDVSFAARPEWFAAREGRRRRLVTRWSARRARAILTLSQFSKREIVTRLAQPPDRIRVIHPGVRPPAKAPTSTREPLVLYVGSIFARRHVDVLVDAFVDHVAPRLPTARLEIVGDDRLPPHARLRHGLDAASADIQARVQFRAYVDEPTLAGLYDRAAVFAFLSEYEGFGLTPLEALAHGAAPVVLDTPVAREIYGEAARFVPLDERLRSTLGSALVELLEQPGQRAALTAHAPALLARYDWSQTAAATLTALEQAAGGL